MRWTGPPIVLWCALVASGCVVSDALVDRVLDADGDGHRTAAAGGDDCDDTRAGVSPDAPERCGNGLDDNCDGRVDDVGVDAITVYQDADGDGHGDRSTARDVCSIADFESTSSDDCLDADPEVFPDAPERCNGLDDDCDGTIDEGLPAPAWFRDADGDGFGQPDDPVHACVPPPNHVANDRDCDDRRRTVHPGADDPPYDGLDADCRGDDDFDGDGDGAAAAPWGADCDDTRPDIHPGAEEVPWNALDEDCDPTNDHDADRDGFEAWFTGGPDCADTDADVYPGAPDVPYDGRDADCADDDDHDADGDGLRGGPGFDEDCDDDDDRVGGPGVWYRDSDLDTWGDGAVTTTACDRPGGHWTHRSGDCDDAEARAHPGALETAHGCDGVDNDCDGATDEDEGVLWFLDFDGDGRGDPAILAPRACEPPAGRWADNAFDCDDDDPDVYVGAPLLCGGGDEDCDPSTPSEPLGCPTDTDPSVR